ncbi:cyclase dehydrase [Dongia deserti]|uniref:cyclase dehydrase n=1 Tax=Dongia deserti TaxID=2268030 RepID=UPI0013C4EA2C|nr:cyclase dehydrase [Dongia deserti]
MMTKAIEPVRHAGSRGTAEIMAQGLGLFSIALGAAELLAPRKLARALDIEGQERLLQAYGLREIGTGIGLLMNDRRAPWMWARVAGDVLDLATLGAAMGSSRRREAVALAIGSVAMVTALDIACARALSQDSQHEERWYPDYSDRSGFMRPAEEMRGAAEFETPPEYRASLKTSEELPRTPNAANRTD